MKIVHVYPTSNIVIEVLIPFFTSLELVAQYYGEKFASECFFAPLEVDQDWIYNRETGTFSPPPIIEPEEKPTVQNITEFMGGFAEGYPNE